jgi:glutathione synthase/RimK-type ligase-like ATP-grasp enzyme
MRIGFFVPEKKADDKMSFGKGVFSSGIINDIKALVEKAGDEVVEIQDFRNSYVKNGKVHCGGICLSDLDKFFYFYIYPSDTNSYEFKLLKTLTLTTRVIPDPYAIERSMNKFSAHTLLRNAGLPTTDFFLANSQIVHNADFKKEIEGKKILLKPTLGSFGHGIAMVESANQLIDVVEYTKSFVTNENEAEVYCEVFEANDISKWISTTIINGKLIYGYRKQPHKFVDGWKVYDSMRVGGAADYVDPAPVAETALKAAKVLGADIIGFDFIYSTAQQKYLIVDENTIPGMYPHCFDAAGQGSCAENFASLIKNPIYCQSGN